MIQFTSRAAAISPASPIPNMPERRINWLPPPVRLELNGNEVHVWAVALDPVPARLAALAAWLSPDERDRAERFRFSGLRTRFTAARGHLRSLLGNYLQLPPQRLEFAYHSRGKPSLTGLGAGQIHFNLTHSQDLALIAVTRAGEVGVDVEQIRSMRDGEAIAERFFSVREVEAFRGVPSAARDAAFFSLWTRKEAWLKATGDGITESLAKIEVTFLPGDTPRVLAIAGDALAGEAWSICPLNPASGFVGAMAIRCPSVRLQCWCAQP
jgi:4'-phosphopantetheinyl transferase